MVLAITSVVFAGSNNGRQSPKPNSPSSTTSNCQADDIDYRLTDAIEININEESYDSVAPFTDNLVVDGDNLDTEEPSQEPYVKILEHTLGESTIVAVQVPDHVAHELSKSEVATQADQFMRWASTPSPTALALNLEIQRLKISSQEKNTLLHLLYANPGDDQKQFIHKIIEQRFDHNPELVEQIVQKLDGIELGEILKKTLILKIHHQKIQGLTAAEQRVVELNKAEYMAKHTTKFLQCFYQLIRKGKKSIARRTLNNLLAEQNATDCLVVSIESLLK